MFRLAARRGGRLGQRSYATAQEQAGTASTVNNSTLSAKTGSSSSMASGASAKGAAMAGRAREGAEAVASRLSGYTSQAGSTLNHYLPGLQYHTRTAIALMKQVYVHQKLAPPSLAEVQSVYSSWFANLKSPQFYVKALESLRNHSSRDLGYLAVVVIEVYGIFAIGQMIGRRKIVGTLAKTPEEH